MSRTVSIPQPKGDPFIGNLRSVDGDAPIQGFMRLARIHGPIFQLDFFGSPLVVVSSQELVNEVCDESRFDKRVSGALKNIRDFAGDGLFTAGTEEPNWAKAHRLLMPAFGPIGIRGMFDRMLDIAEQMVTRWERFGPDSVIEVAEDMTRMTLDTIALQQLLPARDAPVHRRDGRRVGRGRRAHPAPGAREQAAPAHAPRL